MRILVLLEHDSKGLKEANLPTLAAARALGGPVDGLLAGGSDLSACAVEAQSLPGLEQLFVAEAAALAEGMAEPHAELVARRAEAYTHVLASANSFGKNILPRAAALRDCQQISDISKIVSPNCFVRPIYAGNILATVQSEDSIQFITVRGTAFEPDATPRDGPPAPVVKLAAEEVPAPHPRSAFLRNELTRTERPELTSAGVVVSGGRGMQSGDNFAMLERIADRLGAAVGASRAAVDAGFAPNNYQVGQTGKVVAPNLYIAVGISGAIQHLAGMKDSKIIVAINKDADAPIFQVADYGWVADLFEALPELEQILQAETPAS